MTVSSGVDNLDDPVIAAIVHARVWLMMHRPFYGQLAMGLIAVDASKWCDTAATDGKRLYYNRQFVMKLTQDELRFLIAHEVLHCVYDHFGRRGGRDPKIWNMANDYMINYALVEDKCGKMPDRDDVRGLYDKKYTDEMASEEIYDLLVKNCVKIEATLDMHLELGDDDDSEPVPQKVEVTVMGVDGPPKLTQADLTKIRNDLRADILRAAQTAAQSPNGGHMPAGIRRMIDALTKPKLDWKQMLNATIRSAIKDDFTFVRPSRRSWGTNFVLPGHDVANMIDIAIAIDTSGSMTEEMLRAFLSEVKGIMDTFVSFRLRLWTFDTEVYSYKEFTPENADDILTYEPLGGGGTLFEANWEFMKREGIEPERFIMFTDGHPNSTWGDSEYCDTLFIIYGSKTIVAPYGRTAYYDENV